MRPNYTIAIILFLLLSSCNQGNNDNTAESTVNIPSLSEAAVPSVKVIAIKPRAFNHELFANGKLQALRKANLSFQGSGIIESISIREGSRVSNGQLLAQLDMSKQERDGLQAKLKYEQTLLDYQDQLLRAGYQLRDTATLDKEILGIARLRSGLSSAELDIQRINAELQNARLVAPFAGKIANVLAKPHNSSTSYDYICTLIDDSQLEVEFQVLEQELGFIRKSRSVRVQAFSNSERSYKGQITSVNPMVDDAGMITVMAKVSNTDGQLMDGMSVRVVIEDSVPGMLVVPKEAVLDRQNRKVVFTEKDGLAHWNYVEIAAENSREYAISEGLEAGDKVIYSGNFNLAHERPVSVTE